MRDAIGWLLARDASDLSQRGMLIRSRLARVMLSVLAVAGLAALVRHLLGM